MYKKLIMTAGTLMLAMTAFGADDEAGQCDARSLRGDYGFHVEGVIQTIPGLVVPPGGFQLRGVAMTRFDGKGKLTQVDFITVNGAPPPVDWAMGSGTYKVNPDCTGTWQLNIPGNPLSPVNVHFVIVKRGSEIRTVVDKNSVTSIGIKVD
ncbi:MAG: hypothetical protein U0Q16_05410 [Bryobacteraceae bacterium]